MNREIQAIYFYDNYPFFGENTTRIYREALNHFFSFGAKPFDQVKVTDIHEWLNVMEQQGVEPHAIRSA